MTYWLDAYFYFIVYSVAGWLCEDVYVGIGKKKLVNRGFLYGPYCPIYGFGALIVLYPLMMLGDHPVLVFFGGMVLTSVLEYFTSWIMEKLFHERWWDYSTYRFNINGRVGLLKSVLFGLMSLVVVFLIQPHVEAWAHSIPLPAMETFLTVFTIGFFADLIVTCVHLVKRRKVLQKLHKQIEALQTQFEEETSIRIRSMHDQLTEVSTRIGEWVENRPELADRLDELNKTMEKIQKIRTQRLSKAFPSRFITGPMQDSHVIAKYLHQRGQEQKEENQEH